MQSLNNYDKGITYAVAIDPITGRPLPWLLVRQLVTYEHVTLVAKLTVSISTTVRLTDEHSTVARTMMEVSLAWPDSFRRGLAMPD